MNLTDLKIYTLNFGAVALSLTDIELILKVAVLAATFGYTIHKWILMQKNHKK